jgi:hypothetical protein
MVSRTTTIARAIASASTAVEAATPATPTIDKVRVKIVKDRTTGNCSIECSHTPAKAHVVAQYLKGSKRASAINTIIRYGWQNYGVEMICNSIVSVTHEEWQEAIAREIIDRLSKPASEEATELSLIRGDAYMAMAGAVYELRPVGIVRTNNALVALRKQVTAASKKEAVKIVDEAKANAAAIVTTANTRLAKATTRLTDANASPTMPTWMRNLPIRRGPGHGSERDQWMVHGTFDFSIQYFEHTTDARVGTGATGPNRERYVHRYKRWATQPNVPPIKVGIWIPLNTDGTFAQTAIHMNELSPLLPHMLHDHSCLSLSSGPGVITRPSHIAALCEAIRVCFHGVNLGSLLNHYRHWPDSIRAFCTPQIKEALSNWADFPNNMPAATETRDIERDQDDNEVWRAS